MSKVTINHGIDLGTTNSSLSIWTDNGEVVTVKNLDQMDTTPSVVSEDRRGALRVGATAKNALAAGEPNVFYEFKQRMGTTTQYPFAHSDRVMGPQDLSAEILKSLKADAKRQLDVDLDAAVITIPAAFERHEIAATNRAAELAGFSASPLCLEPVAAALAYSNAGYDLSGYSIVFDMGGGTTDTAIVHMQQGQDFELVNHAGDNQLGGKNMDYAMLDSLIIPAVCAEFGIDGIGRNSEDPVLRTVYAKLKVALEAAKIRLSAESSMELEILNLLPGNDGAPLDFYFELTRAQIDQCAMPFIIRAVNLCRRALKEKRLSSQDMQRVLLVGGPTQMPVLRDLITDSTDGFGTPLQLGIDPMTVVSIGAAVFARSQRMPIVAKSTPSATVMVDLKYDPAGSEVEPFVGGMLLDDSRDSFEGFEISFTSPVWQSAKIPVAANGAFMTQLVAEEGENQFQIDVYNRSGLVASEPDFLGYLRKGVFRDIPLTHTISVALANNSVDVIFEKGMHLPVKAVRDYTTVVEVNPSATDGQLLIPLLEGAEPKADRNVPIGFIRVSADQVDRTLPVRSQVEFTLTVDLSQRLLASVYIPMLDKHVEGSIDLTRPEVDLPTLQDDIAAELERFETLSSRAQQMQEDDIAQIFEEISEERMVQEFAQDLVNLASGHGEEIALNRMRDLRIRLDEIEGLLEWPSIQAQAQEWLEDARKSCGMDHATDEDRQRLDELSTQLDSRTSARDVDGLRRVVSELEILYWNIARRSPEHWVGMFSELQTDLRGQLQEPALADELIRQGQRCIDNGDIEGLRAVCRQLLGLLPQEQADALGGFGSTVVI
ncbi:MAG: Hsp70 family protein [Gammaproteobacteria bacterium]|nr:Hsp70 family protein [Gammaproteobacteria bacterium]